MATGTYSYNPADLKGNTMSRMRFELGDTMVQGAENTCAVTDEEINADAGREYLPAFFV